RASLLPSNANQQGAPEGASGLTAKLQLAATFSPKPDRRDPRGRGRTGNIVTLGGAVQRPINKNSSELENPATTGPKPAIRRSSARGERPGQRRQDRPVHRAARRPA